MKAIVRKNKVLLTFAVSLLLALSLIAGSVFNIVSAAGKEPVYGNYFSSDYETREEVLKAAEELNAEIYAEGVTMLKNEGNALPLGEGAKISIFGKNSNSILTGGSGSGAGGGGATVSLSQALSEEGFQINPELISFYNDNSKSGSGRGNAPTNGNVTPGYNTGETPAASYTEAVKASFESYNDAAIVVISRIGGEGFDLPRTMKWNGSTYGAWGTDATKPVPGARSVDDHYLQLDQNETDLIKMCGENFDKVIVLLNTGSQFETGFLDDPGHYAYHANTKAALWIGYPGGTGLRGLAKVLSGEISPSGRTTDTYARDFKTDPVWYNFSNNMMEGNAELKGNQYENLPATGGNGGGGYRNNYVTYKEGIYMGYRYWETRGFDEGTEKWTAAAEDTDHANYLHGTETKEWNNWYEGHVVYPFGYGLSYTEFKQEIVSSTPENGAALTEDGTIAFDVKVTNTGDRAGKEVVQLYYTAPYVEGEIEKAHVVLAAFEKTNTIKPGESETVRISFNVRDMASYDWSDANKNGKKGYELDQGDYTVRLMKDSHDEIASVGYKVNEDIYYEYSEVNEDVKIENRYDEVSNYIDDYMTRNDWAGTFPTTDYKLTAEQWVIDGLKEWDNRSPDADKEEPYYTDKMPTTDAENGLVLADMVGLDYSDPQWEKYLDQFSYDELYNLATQGRYHSGQNYPELGVTSGVNADGPAGFSVGAPSGTYTFWCSETVLASTWNKEIAVEKGVLVGNEALWGSGAPNSRIVGWYAPACNIHRSPFSGRNFEYYSEDGHLSGMMAASVVQGAQEKGLFCYVKHFGVNDQETNRCGLLTWASEQSMREIYLKPFELAVKVGHTMAMMSSLNRIGYTWAGGDYHLFTEILRDEWGFEGVVVTDSYMGDTSGLSNADQMIRAGGNLALGGSSLRYEAKSATTVMALRNAAHGLLYAHANSMAMNDSQHPVAPKPIASFEGTTLPRATAGAAYSADVATAKISDELYPDVPDTEIVYSVAEGSTLPAGLSLSPDGKIAGTPEEEANNFRFTVAATYADYTKTADFIVSIVSAGGSIVYEAKQDLGAAIIGKACDISVAGAEIYVPDATPEEIEKLPPVTYALKDASLLPEGLTLSADGKITGTPSKEAESYKFTVVASALGFKDTELTFTLSVYNEMTFTGKTLAAGKLGVSYVQRIEPAQTANGVTYSLKTGSKLPEGLTLTEQGYITGVPKETVTDHTFVVVATSAYAAPAEAEYKITIGLAFNEFTLPDGKENVEYSARIDTAQGAGTVTYTLKEGSSLPEGMKLSSDGALTGTPTKAGVYTITFVANAEGKAADEITVTLYIANAEGGCGGSIDGAGFALIGAAALVAAGSMLVVKRGKKESRGENKRS